MQGGNSSVDIYSFIGKNSIILTSITDQSYIRQATLFDERDLNFSDSFRDGEFWGAGNAYDYLTSPSNNLYPWVFEEDNFNEISVGRDDASIYSQVYKFDILHKQGELTVYLDGGTRNIFHENQISPVGERPITDVKVNDTGSLELRAEMTTKSTPMNISLIDSTGNPVEDALVEIKSQQIDGSFSGKTNKNGVSVMVQPYGSFKIVATTQQGKQSTVTFP